MGSNANVTFTAGMLPVDFCHTSWQATFNTFISLISGVLPGEFSTFNFGESEPAVEDQDKPWIRTNADGSPFGIFKWYVPLGKWVMFQTLPPPGSIMAYYGTQAGILMLNNYDGDIDNPFWRNCNGENGTPDLRGRVIIGAGEGTGLTLRDFGDTGGEEAHILTADEQSLPVHTHDFGVDDGTVEGDNEIGRLGVDGGHNSYWKGGDATIHIGTTRQSAPSVPADVDPHENMPPFHTLYWIMRTNRLY